MRFRVKDMLLATALLAFYLATFVHIFNSVESGLFLRTGMKLFVATYLGSYFVFVVLHRRWSLGRARPITFSLHASIPWGYLSLSLATVLLIAIFVQSIDSRTGVGIFVGVSTPFLAYLGQSFLFSHVPVGRHGIVYHASFLPWNKITAVYDSIGVIQHLQTSKYRWSSTIKVPLELREQVQQLISQNANKAST